MRMPTSSGPGRLPRVRRITAAIGAGSLLALGTAGLAAGPAAAAGPVQTVLPFTGLSGPDGVALDAAGDVIVADTLNNRVVELPTGATSSSQQVTLPFAGLSKPSGVAVDQAGDVFVLDGSNQVFELPAGATSSSQQVTLPFAGLTVPLGIAADKAGDVYVTNFDPNSGSGQVFELPAGATSSSQQVTLPFAGLTAPFGVTLDAAGDVYVADFTNAEVYELPAGATSSSQQKTLAFTGLQSPTYLTADAAGNVYVSNTGATPPTVVALPAGAASSAQQVTVPFTGVAGTDGLAVDPSGNIYLADGSPGSNNRVLELSGFAFPPPPTVTVTGIRPHHGPDSGGTLVRIHGSGLACPARTPCKVQVHFGTHGAHVLRDSPDRVVVLSPRGHGTVDVTVTVGGVTSARTAADKFTYRG